MSNRVIDATLRFVDKFTAPMEKSITAMTNGSRKAVRLSKSIERAGDSIARVGKSLTTTITLPIIGAGVAAIKTATDFETSMSQVAATMGVSGDAVNGFAELAKEMGRTTVFSATEAASGINTLAMTGINNLTDMESVLPHVLNLASAGAMDLSSAATFITGTVKGFNDEMANAQKYADIMAKGATLANTNVEMLGEALVQASAGANVYNQSVDTTTVSLLRLAEQNVVGSTAATMLNRTIKDLYAPTDKAQKALRKLGISAYDSNGEARDLTIVLSDLQNALSGYSEQEANALKNTIFTTNGLNGFNKMMVSSTEKVNAFYEGISGSGGAATRQAETQLNNLKGQLTLLKSAMEGIAISLGDKLLPHIKKAVEFAQTLADKINNLNSEQLDFILKIAGAVAAVGPALLVFGKLVKLGGSLLRMINLVKGALAASGIVGLISSPVGIAIAAVVALISVGVLIMANWKKIKAKAEDVWGRVKDVCEKAVNSTDSAINKTDELASSYSRLKSSVSEFIDVAKPFFESAKGFYVPIWKKMLEVIKAVLKATGGTALEVFSNVTLGIMGFFNGLLHFITRLFKGDIKGVFDGFIDYVNGLIDIVCAAIQAIPNGIIRAINEIKKVFDKSAVDIPYINLISTSKRSIPENAQKGGGKFAHGTNNYPGGLAQIGERGGEIVDLPSGSRIYAHDKSEKMLKQGNMTFTVAKLADQIIVREEADIDKIATALEHKLSKVALNMGGAY